MAQKSNGRKQAPAYSADTLALRYMAGLALIALGVMIFMAVDLRMPGNIFDALRQICGGLCGSMAMVLPALPLWAGGLVIWSTQRKPPVRPWLFACLAFWGICAFIMVISPGMEYLNRQGGGEWGGAIQTGYIDCARQGTGGGALGMIPAWPLWRFLGTVLGVVLVGAGTLFCLLMAVGLTPVRLKTLLTGQAGRLREQQRSERAQADAQQLAWQQEQARQRAAWEQQQQAILAEQQARAVAQARTPAPMPVRAEKTGKTMPGVTVDQGNRNPGVEAWQDQLTAKQTLAAEGKVHQSRIFGRKPAAEPDSGMEPPPRKSRIFSRKEAYDGLSDGGAPRSEAAGQLSDRNPVEGETKVRRTVTGTEIVRPETHWTVGQENAPWKPEEGQDAPRKTETEPGRAPEEPRTAFSRRIFERPAPAPDAAERQGQEAEPASETVRQDAPSGQRKPEEKRPSAARDSESATGKKPRAPEPEEFPDKPEKTEKRAEDVPAKPRSKVPEVQQNIGVAAYQPSLKLPPRPEKEAAEEDDFWSPTPYHYPPITDLALPKANQENTSEEDAMRSRKLEETLASFKVQARVVNVTHGPAISRFEMELAAGIKVGKVAELERDIAYGMEATSVRIEAPIPGKSLVGVEVPNRKVATVTLREVLESDKMQNAKSILTVALGRDIAGTPIVCDLAKMPHMLIAGQTGSGKSVCINAIINSLLYRASPDEVRLILVDPKVVELQCYNGIPHLLIPVVNDPHKAAAALAWAVAEMMERYDKFAERKVRNLDGYNGVIGPNEKPMSRIVIIIDELADLMMVCKKDVEEYICRLTQLARAAGIHLIVATQRPSVDVITGLIKANIPSRVAFKTASSVDSRTILDRNGSEQLLGWGDMLYLPTGSFAPTRVQGCFLSDDEVNRIVTHVREGNPSTYDPDILEKLEEIAGGGGEMAGPDLIGGMAESAAADGSLFEQAVEYAIADGQISTSTLQRRLKIGYARAGRLTDEMEERGIVAAKDGSKPRKCLITREEWEAMKQSTEE